MQTFSIKILFFIKNDAKFIHLKLENIENLLK